MTCPQGCCPTYRDHLLSVQVAASAMPTRKVEANRIAQTENRWDKDMAAYRRLRKDGLQPKGIDGAAKIEGNAELRHEVESGQLLQTRVQRTQVKELLGDRG